MRGEIDRRGGGQMSLLGQFVEWGLYALSASNAISDRVSECVSHSNQMHVY